ncbi:hypothetical protein L3Q82_007720 [Scortum barcoo]|uniref:Uncharacterized protein n=1 Tax=Scortum barcoo TaxID=214431 RepID=A0ACB8WPA8_9TELE|nr:hypothetical protein L3Q82_007720 [Scortum barcoo]
MGVCPTSPYVLCGSGEGIFDRVPRGILWGVLHTSMGSGAFAKAGCLVSVRPEQELGSHCQHQDLQHVLERFAAECEAAGMRISTSKSEAKAMVLDRKRVACPLQVGGEVLPQVEFKYLWGLVHESKGKMERVKQLSVSDAPWDASLGRCSHREDASREDQGHAGETMSLSWPGNASGSPWKSWRKCLG